MKFLLSFFFVLLFTHAFTQTRDLIALAQGDFVGMNALFDEKGNLFGYVAIYDYGKSGEKTKKFEYVILDKNLNPFANKTFDGDITAGSYRGYIGFDGSVILRPSRLDASLVGRDDIFTPTSMVIDLKTNTIKKKVFYEFDHGVFKEMLQHESWAEDRKEYKDEKKTNGFNYVSFVSEIKEGGFLVSEYDNYGSYINDNHIMRFDENKKEMWRYDYNADGSKSTWQVLRFIEKDSNYFYGILQDKVKREDSRFYLVVIDMKTGKELRKKEIEGDPEILQRITTFSTFAFGQLDNDKTFDDKIVLVGRIKHGYDIFSYEGIARLTIDRKTFNTELKTLPYDDFEGFVPKIKGNGRVEKGYFLDPRDIFFMKDGSVGMLFEKFKVASEYTAQKTTDLVYVYTNKDFKIAGAKIFEKEKSRWENSDYLFSQNLNNGNDLVFFYMDYQKDDETRQRNWNLFINTLIDGKFNQEMIPISSRENFVIYPYIAKEGYILLHEYNKKARYNQARLERLNY